MSTPPPTQPPPPAPPLPEGPPPGRPRRGPKLIGAAVALGVLVIAGVVGLLADQGGLFLPILLVPVGVVIGTLAMISRSLRPYATGFLLTMAAMLIVLGGACIVLLSQMTATA